MREGSPAIDFSLTAAASGRVFNLGDFRSRYVLLIFVSPTIARSSRDVVIEVRKAYPNFEWLPIGVIIDLRSVPGFFRGTAERILESAYREAAADIPPGYAPEDHLILLPDWKGTLTKAYDAHKSDHKIFMILINPEGKVDSSFSGLSSIERLLSRMKSLLPPD